MCLPGTFAQILLLTIFNSVTVLCSRSWYMSDEKLIKEVRISPEIEERLVFDIRKVDLKSGTYGRISCMAVNYAVGNQLFVSDIGDNAIISLIVDPNWSNLQPIRDQKTIVRDRVAYSLTFDDLNEFLFFSTVDQIWRVKPDGNSLKSMKRLEIQEKILTLEFNPTNNKLYWSLWNDAAQIGALMSSRSPQVSCTEELAIGSFKLNNFFIMENGDLYAVDEINSEVVLLVNSDAGSVTNKKQLKSAFASFNSSTATGLFVNSESKMIYLDKNVQALVYCTEEQNSCSVAVFTTIFTPTDLKLNATRLPMGSKVFLPEIVSAKQQYYFSESILFEFEVDHKANVSLFTFKARITIVPSIPDNPPLLDVSRTVEAFPGSSNRNAFSNLLDSSKYSIDISYRDQQCLDSYFDVIHTFIACTEPAEAFGFEFDGSYVFWKHFHEFPQEDWTINVQLSSQSKLEFSSNQSEYPYALNVAAEEKYVIYRLDTFGLLTNNDSLRVVVKFECDGKILKSKAALFQISKIDQVNHNYIFTKSIMINVPAIAEGRKQNEKSLLVSYDLLYLALAVFLLGLTFIIVKQVRKTLKPQFLESKIDQKPIEERVVRYSTLRDSVMSYDTLRTQTHQPKQSIGEKPDVNWKNVEMPECSGKSQAGCSSSIATCPTEPNIYSSRGEMEEENVYEELPDWVNSAV